MAANRGCRVGILARHARSWMGESLGIKGQQRLCSSDPRTSQIGASARSVASFQSQGHRDFGAELKVMRGHFSGASAWRKLDAYPQWCTGLVRNVTTIHQPSEAAAQGEFLVVSSREMAG